jgi:hypothetical protein
MTVTELRDALAQAHLEGRGGCRVCFYNSEEKEGLPYYELVTVEFRRTGLSKRESCVLTDSPEGVDRKQQGSTRTVTLHTPRGGEE